MIATPNFRKVRDTNYVTLKVNFSKENPNDAFLSHYPKIPDYPHFFVLDSKGALMHSQPTHRFEHGKTYNIGKIEAFLKKWSQPPRHWLIAWVSNVNRAGSMSNTVSTNLDGLERHAPSLACPCRRERRRAGPFDVFPRLAGSALEMAAAGFEPAPTPIFSLLTSARLLPR